MIKNIVGAIGILTIIFLGLVLIKKLDPNLLRGYFDDSFLCTTSFGFEQNWFERIFCSAGSALG